MVKERYTSGTLVNITDTPASLPYPHHVGSIEIKPEDMNKITARALEAMTLYSTQELSRLKRITKILEEENIQNKRLLGEIMMQYTDLVKRVIVAEFIYKSEINFEPRIGQTYHLYQNNGTCFLSLIAPEEWFPSYKEKYLATVKLLPDKTWDLIKENSRKLQQLLPAPKT